MIRKVTAEINGYHKRETDTEEYTETYKGEFARIDDALWMKLYSQNPGDDTSLLMKVKKDRVEIRRSGSVKAEYLFEEGRTFMTVYQTPYGTLHFRISTQMLEVKRIWKGWEIDIRYLMKDPSMKQKDSEKVDQTELLLSESRLHFRINF